MNANIISKYHVLFIGLIALTAFSHCSAMQDGDPDSRRATCQLTFGKKAAVLLMGMLALTLPQEVNGLVGGKPCETRDGVCIYYDEGGTYIMEHPEVAQTLSIEGCNGNARCTARRWVKKYDDGRQVLFLGVPMFSFSHDEWTCVCDNSGKEEKKAQRFEQKREPRSNNETCPRRAKFQTPKQTRRNETRGQRGGKKRR